MKSNPVAARLLAATQSTVMPKTMEILVLFAEALAEIRKLSDIVEKYADHTPECPCRAFPDRMTCTCGFSTL